MKGVGCILMNNKTVLLPHFSLNDVCHCLQLLTRKVLPNHNGKDSNKVKIISHVCATHHCCFVIIFCVHFSQMTVELKLHKQLVSLNYKACVAGNYAYQQRTVMT